MEAIRLWLYEALQKYGIGSKTSAGYGYFKKELPPQEKSQEPATQAQALSRPVEHIRPKIPQFRDGQEITGAVIMPTDDLRRIAPPDALAFLRYESFELKDVLVVVKAEEAQTWKAGETHRCLFQREEVRDGCSVLVCQPRPKKERKK
jgi:hypothetical protein